MLVLVAFMGCLTAKSDSASPQACTDMGCTDGVDLRFSLTERGPYVIVAEGLPSGETTTCTGTLPFDGTEACTGPGFATISGTKLPDDQQSVEGLYLPDTDLAQVRVTITSNDVPRVDQTWDLSYRELQPNGPGCEPTCDYASIEVPL